MSYDIFVSYASADKSFVDALVHSLEATGIRCWYAPRDIPTGMEWPAAITGAIKESSLMLLVFSKNSNMSQEVAKELAVASNNSRLVVPVNLDRTIPSAQMEYHLTNRHWLDVYNLAIEAAIKKVHACLVEYEHLFTPGEKKLSPPVPKDLPLPPLARSTKKPLALGAAVAVCLVLAALFFFRDSLLKQADPPPSVAPATVQVAELAPPATQPNDAPPEALVRAFLEQALGQTDAAIDSLQPDWKTKGEAAYEGTVAVTFEFIRPLFEAGTLDEALGKAGEKSAETALLNYSLEQAATLPEPARGSLLEMAPKTPLHTLEFIKETVPAKHTRKVVVLLHADRVDRGWKFTVVDTLSDPKAVSGRERSHYSKEALIIGTDETRQRIQTLVAETRQFANEVENAGADARKTREESIAAHNAALAALLKPGSIFWGLVENEASEPLRLGFIVHAPDATNLLYSMTVLLPDTFPDMPRGTLLIHADSSGRHSLLLTIGKSKATLEHSGDKLAGPLQGATGKATFTLITAEQLEQEKERSARRLAAKNARQEKADAEKKANEEAIAAHNEALVALLKPGNIFWGVVEKEDDELLRLGFMLHAQDATGVVYPVTVFLPDAFPDLPLGNMLVRADASGRRALLLELGKSKVALEHTGDKLTGPLQGATGKATFTLITAEQLEQEKARSAQRLAGKKALDEKNSPATRPDNTVPASPYPPLKALADGKPLAAVHLLPVEGTTARLALQILAPNRTIEAVRIDNVDGVASRWRSDGKESAEPLTVMDGASTLAQGRSDMAFVPGEAEKLLTLSFTDNGAVAGRETTLRITVFFTDKSRVACLLAK